MGNKLAGNKAEKLVFDFLVGKGFIGEIIETKMRMARIGGRVIQVPAKGEKLGDIIGLWNTRGVLVEVKDHDEDRLQYSVLRDHQHAALRAWAGKEGAAYVAWVRGKEFALIVYPKNWEPRQSLMWEDYGKLPG